jgi:hypothetical protein
MAVPVARRRGWVVVKAAGGLTAVAARGSGGAVRWTSSGPGAAVGGWSGGSRTHCGGSRAAVKAAERWCRVEVKASDGPMTVAAGGSAGAGGWPSSGPGANEGGRLGGSRAAGGLGAVAGGSRHCGLACAGRRRQDSVGDGAGSCRHESRWWVATCVRAAVGGETR